MYLATQIKFTRRVGERRPSIGEAQSGLCLVRIASLIALAFLFGLACPAVERANRGGYLLLGWTSEDGLVVGDIRALARTPDGFLWLGTDLGLIRFDGEQFRALDARQFPVADGDRVSCLLVDRRGALWAGTQRGRLLRGLGGLFQEMQLPVVATNHQLNALFEDREGALWVATSAAGVLRYLQGGWQVLGATNGLPNSDVTQVLADARGQVWVVAGGQLAAWHGPRWKVPTVAAPSAQRITAIAARAAGKLWVATTAEVNFRGARLFTFDGQDWIEELTPYPWPQDSMRSAVYQLIEDKSGGLWVGTAGGGVFRRQTTAKWLSMRQGPLAHDPVNALLLDEEGTLWFGLQGGQLFQAHSQAVTAYRLDVPNEQNIAQSVCAGHDGSLWVGTYGAGAYCLRDGLWTNYGLDQGLTNLYVFSIYEDSSSNLWAGTRWGLYRFNGEGFELFSGFPFSDVPVLSLLRTRDGALWLGSNRDVRRLKDGNSKIFGRAEGITLPDDVRALAEDQTGRVWAAVRHVGLFRQVNEERFEQYQPKQWPNGVDIRALHFDAQGTLWLATHGDGLFQLKEGRFRQWTLRDGVPSDYLVGLAQDGAGTLWLSTLNGIFGCAPQSLNSYAAGHGQPLPGRHLSVAEGLDGPVCSGWGQPVAARSQDGRLWFPNQRAVAVFDPAAFIQRGPSWPVTIEEVRVDGVVQSLSAGPALRIQSGARQVEFHYTLPILSAPERLRFRYRLNGLDEEWTDAQQRRTAYYNRLRPGHYQFSVMACGPEGLWQETRHPLQLEIVPLLWERTSIRATAVASALGAVATLVWVIGRARMRGRLLRLRARQAAEWERQRIARDLHDELGSGLTEIMLMGDLGSQEGVATDEARETARNIAHKTRQLASALDEIVWTTNPRNDAMPKLTGYLCDYAQQFLRTTPVRCRLEVNGIPEDIRLKPGSRHNLLLAYKEALRNAVCHSGARQVWVRIQCNTSRLRIAVEDDGRGFDPATLSGQRNGLQNMRERLEAIGGQVNIRSGPEQGTTVAFELDLARS